MFFVAAVLFILYSKTVDADDYVQYMYDRKVEVGRTKIRISFRWKSANIFKSGDEFEISTIINPKYFAKPKSGFDHKLTEDFNSNFPCRFRDIFNYDIPGDKSYLYNTIIQQCENHNGKTLSQAQKDWIWKIAQDYSEAAEDGNGNFGVGTTCPENFKKDIEYWYEYYIKPVPAAEIPYGAEIGEDQGCIGDFNVHPDWGYFWLTAKLQPDTLRDKNSSVSVSDCPYLIGIPDTKDNYPNQGTVALLFNRGCATTTRIEEKILPSGFTDPTGNNWKNNPSWRLSCRDCDKDGLYDTDFAVPMYGSRTIDCNDGCRTVNVCSNSHNTCMEKGICSLQCGGSGCEHGLPPECPPTSNTCSTNFQCLPFQTASEFCNGNYFSTRKRLCLADCTWGEWGLCSSLIACSDCDNLPQDPCITNPICNAGESKSQPCSIGGFQGTQTALCNNDCQWGSFGPCQANAECNNGATETCNNCGLKTCVNGQWTACGNEGSCTPGQQAKVLCSDGVHSESMICNDECKWETTETCPATGAVCTPNQVETQACAVNGQYGNQTRTCNANGQWDPWSSCVLNCQCQSGACCNGCNYYANGTYCNGYEQFQCSGSGAGSDVLRQVINQYCSGYSAACDGTVSQSGWSVYQDCSGSQTCQMNGSTASCVPITTCTDTYSASSSSACLINSGKPGTPTICLNLQQVSGSSWKFQVCLQSGTFPQDFSLNPVDENHTSQNLGGPWANTSDNSCSQWHDFSVAYIPGYGAINGAGIKAELVWPLGGSTTYYSGTSTILKECK